MAELIFAITIGVIVGTMVSATLMTLLLIIGTQTKIGGRLIANYIVKCVKSVIENGDELLKIATGEDLEVKEV